MPEININKQKWATVKQLATMYIAFPENSIRWLIRTGEIASCIRKIRGKLLINVEEFETWVDSQTIKRKEK